VLALERGVVWGGRGIVDQTEKRTEKASAWHSSPRTCLSMSMLSFAAQRERSSSRRMAVGGMAQAMVNQQQQGVGAQAVVAARRRAHERFAGRGCAQGGRVGDGGGVE
jgi:hypothetical protein